MIDSQDWLSPENFRVLNLRLWTPLCKLQYFCVNYDTLVYTISYNTTVVYTLWK